MSRFSRFPAVSQAMNNPPPSKANMSAVWPRLRRWAVATAKRVYPMILVGALLTTALVAIIALRLAIWLPQYIR